MKLEGKVVLVTGSAKRVGRAIALELAQRGASIAVHYRTSRAEAERAADEIRALGVRAEVFPADLARPRAASSLPGRVAKKFKRLDAVVASASVYRDIRFEDLDEKAWDFHIDANLKSTYLLALSAAPLLPEGGAIVTIGDVMGLRPYPNLIPYGVSKAGVIFLTQALAQAMAPRIRVNCLCPGPVLPPAKLSPRGRRAIQKSTPLGIGDPAEVARGVAFLLESDYATGSILALDGGRNIAR